MTKDVLFDVVSMFYDRNSGATLLAILLNNHPDLCHDEETYPFGHEDETHYRCSCGNRLYKCNFHQFSVRAMRDPDTQEWNNELFQVLRGLSKHAAHMDFIHRTLRFLATSVYVDGSKNLRKADLFVRRGNVKLKAIHMIRDGRGVCYWYYKKQDKPTRRDLRIRARQRVEHIRSVALIYITASGRTCDY